MGGWQPHPPTSKSIVVDVSINNKRSAVADLKEKLARAEADLNTAIRACKHKWSPVEAAHIYHPGYKIEGDPVGTMGIDWRGPCYVESRTEKRWKRTCEHCGEIQYTSETTKHVTEEPKF